MNDERTHSRSRGSSLISHRSSLVSPVPFISHLSSLLARSVQCASMPLQPNTTLGPYTIIGILGEGGMGAVYRARDTRLGRDVAIKVLTNVTLSDRERLQRFEQEARATGMLNHPNLLT